MSKRTFTKTEKLSILKEASTQGVLKTIEKQAIYPNFSQNNHQKIWSRRFFLLYTEFR